MNENPFIISEKVIPELFCDRKKESADLIRLVTNRNNVVLISNRRIGKTGLILYCFQDKTIKKDYLTFYVDILSTSNLQEFIYLLGKEIVSVLQPLGKKMIASFIATVKSLSGNLGFDVVSGSPVVNFQLGDITHPEYTLKEIFQYLNNAGKPCIIAIDEFQQVAKYPEKGVEALLRSHILQINNCRFIFSGSEHHLIEQMFLNPSRPFYNSCAFIDLKVIPKDIYVDFIVSMFKKRDKKISADLAGKIYDLFEGYTFYVQRICNGIFEMTSQGEWADEKMLEDTVLNVLYSYDTIFRERLSRLTIRQKELLFAIAMEGDVDKITSVDFIRKHSLASASAVQTSLKALNNMGILDKDGGRIFIAEKFFSMWIKKNFIR